MSNIKRSIWSFLKKSHRRILHRFLKSTDLYLLAHPDDEVLFAGTIATRAKRGRRQVIVYLTWGEGGQTSGLCKEEELPQLRRLEQQLATQTLGVSRIITFNQGDGNLANLPIEKLKRLLIPILWKERPQAIFTFSSTGVTSHSDHQTMSSLGLEAVKGFWSPVQLFFRIIPQNALGIDGPIEYDDLSWTHCLKVTDVQTQIIRAMLSHQTQLNAMSTIFPALRFLLKRKCPNPFTTNDIHEASQLLWEKEFYRRVR